MKKTFRLLTLGLMLLGGTLSSWAGTKPATGTAVGATVSGGVVTYIVTDDPIIDGAFPVEIQGLDADGLAAEGLDKLNILTTFKEKFGTVYNTYYVVRIVDASKDNKVAFWGMRGLKELTFRAPEDGEASYPGLDESKFTFTVGEYAFYGCDGLTTLELPDNVNKIGKYAFQDTKIGDFTIPAKCATIGENAFYNTKLLKTVSVGVKEGAKNDVMTELGEKVFANSSVHYLDLSDCTALKTINDKAFIYDQSVVANSLWEITVPASLESLGAVDGTAFANLSGLKKIKNLENTKVKDFRTGAFENCEALTELNFPVQAILYSGATSPFLGCKSLKKLTFADGWYGEIAGNLYLSAKGTKKGVAYSLTPAQQKQELSYLEEIEFKGNVGNATEHKAGLISDYAFGNNDEEKACSGLAKVTFGGTILGGTYIGDGAFLNCAALATLAFANNDGADTGFAMTAANTGDIYIGDHAFALTAIETVDFEKINLNSGVGSVMTISPDAFAIPTLTKATFGEISFGNAADEFIISGDAFISDLLTEVAFGDVKASNANGKFTVGTAGNPAFYGDKNEYTTLKKVTFGNLTTGTFTLNDYAFYSEVLETVTIGNVTTAGNNDGSLTIGYGALGYYWDGAAENKAVEKTVTIGNINEAGTGTLTLDIDDCAFAGDKLKSVTIGELGANKATIGDGTAGWSYGPFGSGLTAKTVQIGDITGDDVEIGNYAFAADGLTSVTIGKISGKKVFIAEDAFGAYDLATVTIGDITGDDVEFDDWAIANYRYGSDSDPLTMNVTIGNLATDGLTIGYKAFRGPDTNGSTLNVTIGNITGKPTIASQAFWGAGHDGKDDGTTTFTVGDIDADVSGIAAQAFYGSCVEDADGNDIPNTSVKIGKYNNKLNNSAFYYVNDLTAEEWNVASTTLPFRLARTITVNGNMTKNMGGDNGDNTVETLTFKGNVSAKIGANTGGFGTKVREIRFDNDDPEVIENAIVAGAFAAASDAAKDDEKIIVVYKTKTAIKSNKILAKEAFGTDDKYMNVILYTDDWSKANTFENVEILANRIWRLTLSASEIVPGDAILAKCVAQSGGKYAYGKLFVPKGSGMKYYVDAEVEGGVTGVNLFSATIDGSDIRMKQVDIIDGCYWIDASERDQVFVVRTSATRESLEVEAQAATDDIIAAQETLTDDDWFDASLGKKNALRYTPVKLENQELRDFPEFEKKGIYVMANPKNRGLAFALLNQYDTDKEYTLAAKSVYVLTKKDVYARELNVIWDDDSEATGISTVKNEENSDVIYNLQGVRVNKAQKGVFIINGKKVVK